MHLLVLQHNHHTD